MDRMTQIYVFGDQTSDFDAGLRRLLSIKNNAILTAFFEQLHYSLKVEIGRLPGLEREKFPRFTNFIDLLARYRESGNNPALESTFTCAHQLASFINYYGDGSQTYPLPYDTYLVGLCTGLLAAAAISSARTAAGLLPAAIEAVLVAFRVGLRASEVRNRLAQGDPVSVCWSVVIPSLSEESASNLLNEFYESQTIPPSSRPYISAVTPNSVTISGPPNVVDDLLDSPPFANIRSARVQIHAPYHAPHLYNQVDISAVIALSPSDPSSAHSPRIPIISSATGKLIDATDYTSLVKKILEEILIEPLRWDKALEGCKAAVKASGVLRCTVLPIATNTTQSMISALGDLVDIKVKINDSLTKSLDNIRTALPTGRPEHSKIAIIGSAGRFPDAANSELFWDLLYKGLDVHREVPPDRYDLKTYLDPTGKKKNTSQISYGCWIENPGLFDARFFSMSPREAAQADPGQRLAITTAYEALEKAGFVPNRTPSSQRDRVGIFYGMTSDDWREVNSGQNIDTYFIPGGNRAFTPGRINFHFNFSGPSYSVDTACSSSLAAIHLACNSLWKGDCDTALAGGTNVMTNPDNFSGLDKGHFLSRTGNCKTFDDDADGYCRADGVGTVVLKRLEDALEDNDPIEGVIVGAYTNHSAEAVSITRPHAGAQAFIFDKMVNEASIDPSDVSYIEFHGTGTQAGDAVEMKSVLDIFAPTCHTRRPEQTLHIGSAKASVGHAEAASGVISLIKIMLMMEKNTIPPHCGIKTKINHTFPTNLKERNVHLAKHPTTWVRQKGQKRKVFLNNFSAAGGNTALLIEDAPMPANSVHRDSRSAHLVAISAKSIQSLKKNVQALEAFLRASPDLSLPKLSYTTTARRMHHNYRVIVSGSRLEEIQEALNSPSLCEEIKPVTTALPNVAFAFTGQGAQYVGMGKQFYKIFSQFRSDIQRFDSIGQSQGFTTILPLIDGSVTDIEELSPVVVQLGTTCLQMALTRLWISWGVQPTVVVGHSLGEYAALNIAGVLSASDTIYLTGKRANLLQEQCTAGTHAMLAVKASISTLSTFIDGKTTEAACINTQEDTVISGTIAQIEAMSDTLTDHGIKSIKLKVPFAFHSAQVQPILNSLEAAAQGVTFNKPSIPVISPFLGNVVTDVGTFGPRYLSRHCRETVNFLEAVKAAKAMRIVTDNTLWVEIGSHSVCSSMIKTILGSETTTLPSLKRKEDVWKVLTGSLSTLHSVGIDIQWNEYHRDFKGCHEVIRLPAYNWESKNYWIQYVHDWCLTKGNPPALTVPLVVPSRLSTSSVQRIIEEHIEKTRATIIVESDLSEPHLNAAIKAHTLNGAALCPSSVYADIALTLGDYVRTLFKSDKKHAAMNVSDMVIEKPLIAKKEGTQLLRASVQADWVSNHIAINFYSVTEKGQKTVDHGRCMVKYGDPDAWVEEWRRITYLIQDRINGLEKGVNGGKSHSIKRGMAYKLFAALVEYDQKYRGMEEVILDSAQLEASARIVFQASEKDGNFYQSPYWTDSLGHVSGFTMNANDAVDSKTQLYVNHGWDSMRCSRKFSSEKTYRNYVKMQKANGTMYVGDVYIFEGDTIIAVFGGVKFQGIPRRLLDSIVPPTITPRTPTISTTGKSTYSPTTCRPEQALSMIPQSSGKPVSAPSVYKKPANLGIVGRAMTIVAEEIGVPLAELSDSSSLADFGVDSLLGLTIAGKFREQFDVEVESTLFANCATVKDLKDLFSQGLKDGYSLEPVKIASSASSATEWSLEDTMSESSLTEDRGESDTSLEDDDVNTMASIRLILANEIGVPIADLKRSENLSELGMDSLMSLTVLGEIRETLGIDLPAEFFIEHPTLDAIEAALGVKPKAVPPPPLPTQQIYLPMDKKLESKLTPTATSILLQGNPRTASKMLFLFPDGSGSSTSYAPIPLIDSDVAVYGLNCPYMRNPQDLRCGLEGLTVPYLKEVRRRQPTGPYNFGGWSAGGICAFDAAQEVIREGGQVERLILLDSPFPIGLEKLPPRLYHFFESIGMFGDGSKAPPEWLLPHFMAFVDALDKYRAVPFRPATAPATFLVWATDGVCKHPGDPRPERIEGDPKEMWWLLDNRKNLGPNGWDTLVGGENLRIEAMENANHFSLMEGENARKLSQFIGRAMT